MQYNAVRCFIPRYGYWQIKIVKEAEELVRDDRKQLEMSPQEFLSKLVGTYAKQPKDVRWALLGVLPKEDPSLIDKAVQNQIDQGERAQPRRKLAAKRITPPGREKKKGK